MKKIRLERLDAADRARVVEAIDGQLCQMAGSVARDEKAARAALVGAVVKLAERMTADADLGPDGAYLAADEAATLLPVLYLNGRRSPHIRGRVLAHEMAQHLQRVWVAPALYDADEVICTEQDNRDVRHQIARAVDQRWGG